MAAASKSEETTFTTPSERELRAVRVLDAPRELVWEVWTSPGHIPHWTSPDGWEMHFCEMDLRPGGKWRWGFRTADSEVMGMSGKYTEVAPPERLIWTETWDGEWPETTNTMLFTEKQGKTTLRCTVDYPSRDARDKVLGTGMKEGWAQSNVRLDKYLQKLQGKDK